MALISYVRGQASVILRVKLLDSSVATGAGLTGLTFSSAGLIISTIADNEATPTVYTQAAGNIETIATLGTYAAPTASKCRFKEVDATNHPGVYEIQLADARMSVASAKSLVVSFSGATNLAETDTVIPLLDADPYNSFAQDIAEKLPTTGYLAGAALNDGLPLLAANAVTATALATDAVNEIRDAVWNAVLSNYTVVGSGGRILDDLVLDQGLIATESGTSVQLSGTAPTDIDAFNDAILVITGGPGAKQSRRIVDWGASSRTATIEREFDAALQTGVSTYAVFPGARTIVTDATVTDINLATDIKLDRNADLVESQRGEHTWQGNWFYVDFENGNDTTGDGTKALPYKTPQNAMIDLVTAWNHDVIFLVAGDPNSLTTITDSAAVVCNKAYVSIRGPGRDLLVKRTAVGNTFEISVDGVELSGFRIETHTSGAGNAVDVSGADFAKVKKCWFTAARADAICMNDAEHCIIDDNVITNSGVGGASAGIRISAANGDSDFNEITNNVIIETTGDGILVTDAGGGNSVDHTIIHGNRVIHNTGTGINISGANVSETIAHGNISRFNTTADFTNTGTDTITENNEQWAKAGAAVDDLDDLPTAAEIVDEWETQSQANPTGFHINLMEWRSTAVVTGAIPAFAADTAGGLPVSDAGGLDLDTQLANTNEVTAARMGALTDWINGGRLDLILDIIAVDTTTDIPALIAGLNNISAADVNTTGVFSVISVEVCKIPLTVKDSLTSIGVKYSRV